MVKLDILTIFLETKTNHANRYLKNSQKLFFGKTLSHYNPTWIKKHHCHEYDLELDAAFCFHCRKFLLNSNDQAFTKIGFRDWNHASEVESCNITHSRIT